jgi:hypothetical protein
MHFGMHICSMWLWELFESLPLGPKQTLARRKIDFQEAKTSAIYSPKCDANSAFCDATRLLLRIETECDVMFAYLCKKHFV